MRAALFALLALGALVLAYASTPPSPFYRQHMTGQQFVRDMRAAPDGGGLNSFKRERAIGYMDGLMDASVGVRWCPGERPLSHELNYDAAEHMDGLGPDQLKVGAATLILGYLAKRYPCTGARP